jgi:heme/copper-type cytochrome/quinol oxidase subunit 2
MTNLIEETERQQQKYWKGFLIAWFMAIVLLIVRHLFGSVFKQHELNSRPIGIAVLTVTVILLLMVLFFVVKLYLLFVRAKSDPQLKEALIDNELSRLYILQSWKPAFIAAVATPFAFLLISSFHPINDLLLIALTTCVVGSGAFLTSFYLKSNK